MLLLFTQLTNKVEKQIELRFCSHHKEVLCVSSTAEVERIERHEIRYKGQMYELIAERKTDEGMELVVVADKADTFFMELQGKIKFLFEGLGLLPLYFLPEAYSFLPCLSGLSTYFYAWTSYVCVRLALSPPPDLLAGR